MTTMFSADPEFDHFYNAYVECALWTCCIDPGDGTDDTNFLDAGYGPANISPEAKLFMVSECKMFYDDNRALWEGEADYSADMAGHDFWLTRNGHGAGFWDRGITHGEELTAACRPWGECDLWLRDDGMIDV